MQAVANGATSLALGQNIGFRSFWYGFPHGRRPKYPKVVRNESSVRP